MRPPELMNAMFCDMGCIYFTPSLPKTGDPIEREPESGR